MFLCVAACYCPLCSASVPYSCNFNDFLLSFAFLLDHPYNSLKFSASASKMSSNDGLPDLPSGPLDVYRKQSSFCWKKMMTIIDGEDAVAHKVEFIFDILYIIYWKAITATRQLNFLKFFKTPWGNEL